MKYRQDPEVMWAEIRRKSVNLLLTNGAIIFGLVVFCLVCMALEV